MQKYQRTYMNAFGINTKDKSILNELKSELSGQHAQDIHHIKYGCSLQRQDYPVERLIMLTRLEHDFYGDKKQWFDYLIWMHIFHMNENRLIVNIDNLSDDIVSTCMSDYEELYEIWKRITADNTNVSIWNNSAGCVVTTTDKFGRQISYTGQTKLEALRKI